MKNWELKVTLALLGFMFGLALPALAWPQTAKVMAVTPEDTTQIVALRAAADAANKALSDFNEKVRVKYITTLDNSKGNQEDVNVSYTSIIIGCNITHYYGAVPLTNCDMTWSTEPVKPRRYKLTGWEYGFEWSEDFRYIVPVRPPTYSTQSGQWNTCPWYVNGGVITTSPATNSSLTAVPGNTTIEPYTVH
jgi:hypothetical protein